MKQRIMTRPIRLSLRLMLLVFLALGWGAGCRRDSSVDSVPIGAGPASAEVDGASLAKEVSGLRKENEQLRTRLDKLMPKDPYIVINTTLNRLSLKKGDQVLVDAVCSTGSNTQLVEPSGKRKWFFSTPKGVFSVKNKMIAPVWVKPDWAFIEEGDPVPGPQASERFEEGFLGKYGLYFGNGYLIHGTLFQRFLGQSVTHGCVRLGDADLEKVYENSKVGTKIYIY
jgi:L,D-transpeptidase ErfK/SrfK